jgi:tetratricopeptide (TPR) repeat protein
MRALLVAIVLFLGAPALAAPSDAKDARTLFEQGRSALSTGRFAEARDLFKRSLALVPKSGSAFNLAVALRGTGEAAEAVGTLDRLLAGDYGALAKAQRNEAESLRSQALGDVAILEIIVVGSESARIKIDGVEVTLGSDRTRTVDAGLHSIEASASGFTNAEQRLEATRGGRAKVELTLIPIEAPRTGTLVLEATPEDRVRIVGQAEGQGSLERALDPGSYRLEADGPSGLRSLDATIVAGETLRVRMEAEESSIASSPWLWIGVGAAVIAAGVIITVVAIGGAPEPISDPTYGVIQTLRRE